MVRARITGLALVAAFVMRHRWLQGFLIANAVVGMIYMQRERKALRDVGTSGLESLFGIGPLCLTYAQNVAVNVLFHVILTSIALSALRTGPSSAPLTTILLQVLGLLVLDLDAIYPTEDGLMPYVVAHVVIVLAWQRARGRSGSRAR